LGHNRLTTLHPEEDTHEGRQRRRRIMLRQERIVLHMCDAIAKVTSGDRIGVFAMAASVGRMQSAVSVVPVG
jgi:hypothetical protein